MRGAWRALLRLFAVQASWNYERMQGIGMGYAAEPLLADLKRSVPARYPQAVVRSAEYFNCHPYLAGLALGALARAEQEGVPGPQILRLRTALCSPLGALGDQVFWAGLVPALVGAALVAATVGSGPAAVAAFLVVFNGCRLATAWWALRTGLAFGLDVGRAMQLSWLSRAAARLGPAAGFAVGLAIPVVVGHFLQGAPGWAVVATVGVCGLGALLMRRFGATVTAVRYGLVMVVLALLWR